MKIVHVEDFFHPDAGYQLNLLTRLQVLDGHEITIITAELDRIPTYLTAFFGKADIEKKDLNFQRETGVKIVRVPLWGFYSGRAFFYPRIFKLVSAEKPDVVFVHGEDTVTGMTFIWLSRWLNYPLVFDCHMVEMASLNRFRNYFRSFYRRFVTPIILRRKIPLIRVVDSDYVEKCLGIPLTHTDLLSFGTDTNHFAPDPEAGRLFREKIGISQDAFLVLYAGKLDETKGGAFLASSLKKSLRSSGRKIEVLIVGNSDGAYGEGVEALFRESENRIKRLPTQRYFELARIYQAADLAVFPKQCSMSFFEAQSCGLPVLFEDNEINRQRARSDNAFLFMPGDEEDFRAKIEWLEALPREYYDRLRRNARDYVLANYDYVPIARKFTSVCIRAMVVWRGDHRRAPLSDDANG